MIRCGWCGNPTTETEHCSSCGHVDPRRPWIQRGEVAPAIAVDVPGRPALDVATARRRLADARAAVGPDASVERLAEFLDVSPRTIGRWQKLAR